MRDYAKITYEIGFRHKGTISINKIKEKRKNKPRNAQDYYGVTRREDDFIHF